MTDSEKLLDILMDELPDKHPWEGEIRKLRDRLIAQGVTFDKDINVPNWIPVTERLPETQVEVLTYSECNGVRSACLLASDDKTTMWYLCKTDKLSIAVTHWMPLPQPPKGE